MSSPDSRDSPNNPDTDAMQDPDEWYRGPSGDFGSEDAPFESAHVAEQDQEQVLEEDDDLPPEQPLPGPPAAPVMPAAFVEQGKADHVALTGVDPEAGADEQLLMRMVSDTIPGLLLMNDYFEQLALRLPRFFHDPKPLLQVMGSMKELVSLRNALLARNADLLLAASSLRGTRRMLRQREAAHDV